MNDLEEIKEPEQKPRFRIRRRKKTKKAEEHEEKEIDILKQNMSTPFSPESISEELFKDAINHPEYYLEINMIKKSRMIDTFYIPVTKKDFTYDKKKYIVDEERIFLLPNKMEKYTPTSFYTENTKEPKSFMQCNKGISGKSLSLLYMKQLYRNLIFDESLKYNFFIVLLTIATLIAFGIGIYLLIFHGASSSPPTNLPPVIGT